MARLRAGRKGGGGETWPESGFMLKVELTALADGLEMHRERREGREVRDGSKVFCLGSWKDGVVTSCEGAAVMGVPGSGVLCWNC